MMMTSKPKRRSKKMVIIILLSILILLIAVASIFIYKGMRYWQNDLEKTMKAGFIEQQAILPDGSVINYAKGPDNGDALLLIHGQTGAWQDYSRVLPELSKTWQVFVVDCYGHGGSSHEASKYYLQENGDDLIWFIDEIIGKQTVVSGHSSGGLMASYIAAYGGDRIVGAVLEDPPVFSTESDYFEQSFAYQDTYKLIHEYGASEQTECWEAYYLRNCLWGQLYMASSMNGIANYAQWYHEKNKDKPVQIFFMSESVNFTFLYSGMYDHAFGEHFYDYTWHSGICHETLMADIRVPTVFLHIEEQYSEDGILMAASTNDQVQKASELINDCELIELTGNHDIHRFQPEDFISVFERFQRQ